MRRATVHWYPARDDALMELVSEGLTLRDAAKQMGMSKSVVARRFSRLREAMGAQAV